MACARPTALDQPDRPPASYPNEARTVQPRRGPHRSAAIGTCPRSRRPPRCGHNAPRTVAARSYSGVRRVAVHQDALDRIGEHTAGTGEPAILPPVRRRRTRVRDLKQPSGASAKTSTRAPRKLSFKDGNAVASALASRSRRRSPGICARSRYSCVCRGKVGRWDSAGPRRRGWGFPSFATPSGLFIVLALFVPGSGRRGRRGQ